MQFGCMWIEGICSVMRFTSIGRAGGGQWCKLWLTCCNVAAVVAVVMLSAVPKRVFGGAERSRGARGQPMRALELQMADPTVPQF